MTRSSPRKCKQNSVNVQVTLDSDSEEEQDVDVGMSVGQAGVTKQFRAHVGINPHRKEPTAEELQQQEPWSTKTHEEAVSPEELKKRNQVYGFPDLSLFYTDNANAGRLCDDEYLC
jgi:hypothetical protein